MHLKRRILAKNPSERAKWAVSRNLNSNFVLGCSDPNGKVMAQKWTQRSAGSRLNVRPETTKLPEAMGNAVFDLGLSNSVAKGNERKNKQIGLCQTNMFLHSKENHQQNEKTTY